MTTHPLRNLLVAILAKQGWTVLAAHDGHEALNLARAYPVEFVISDVEMPGPSGVQVARHLRQERPDTRILLISGSPRPDTTEFAFLAKPFRAKTLLRKIDELLGGARFGAAE